MHIVIQTLICIVLNSSSSVFAGDRAHDVLNRLIDQFGNDLKELDEKKLTSFTLGQVAISEQFPFETKDFVSKRIEVVISKNSKTRFIHCVSCNLIKAHAEDGKIIVRKGLADQATFSELGKQLGVASIMEANISYSAKRLLLNIAIYRADDASLVWARSYSARVLSLERHQFKIGLTTFQGISSAGKPFAYSIAGGERLFGLGEFNLELTHAFAQSQSKSLFALGPSLGVNLNEIFDSPWSWGSLSILARGGYGWYGGAASKNLVAGGGLKLEFGSFFHATTQVLKGFALSDSAKNDAGSSGGENRALPLTIFVGFGIEFGL